ncbi:MAG: acetamidase/formamidase family protein [Verrucomicrobia bacterium]|nr:acetamidase/formamidase family protein [Verrucomicrobiota bacterium]
MKRLTRDKIVPGGMRYKVFEPAMTVEPGETILVETINHMTPIVETEADLHPHGSPEYRERCETGPIHVKGAKPGDMLAVRIEQINVVGLPHAHGWGPLYNRETGAYKQEPLGFPVENGAVKFPGDIRVPLAPMVGDIYTTPGDERHYYDHGGNMDFVEVRPGNTLYLPVLREGGLLVLGDVHAYQGDAEIYGEAAETAAEVTVTLDVDRTYRSPRPIVETPECLICIAARGALFDGIALAVADMTDLLVRVFGLDRQDAYVYATLGASLRLAGCASTRGMVEKDSIACLSVLLEPLRQRARS